MAKTITPKKEVLSQKDIDDLLNISDNGEKNQENIETTTETENEKVKVFNGRKKIELRFRTQYISPVIKKRDYIENSDNTKDYDSNKIIVETIDHYNKRKIKKYV